MCKGAPSFGVSSYFTVTTTGTGHSGRATTMSGVASARLFTALDRHGRLDVGVAGPPADEVAAMRAAVSRLRKELRGADEPI
jgi:hypothetical protein